MKCPTCNGKGYQEFCPARSKGWCAELGFCRVCHGTGHVESAKDVVRRIVQRHMPVDDDRCSHYDGKARELCESGMQEL